MSQADEILESVAGPRAKDQSGKIPPGNEQPKKSQADRVMSSVLGDRQPKAGQADQVLQSVLGHRAAKVDPVAIGRVKTYRSTLDEGYSPDQASQRIHEYNYAVKNNINPERAQEYALSKQFAEGTPKYTLSDEEKTDLYSRARQAAEQFKSGQQKTIERHIFGGFVNPDLVVEQYRYKIDPDDYAKRYVEGYSYARAQGWDEGKSQEYATSDAALKLMTRAGEWFDPKWHSVKTAILKHIPGISKPEEQAENPYFQTDQGARGTQFHVYHEASWLDKRVGKTAGSVDAGLGNVVNGFMTPGMAALMVVTEGQGLLARGGLAAEAEEANLATRALGRVSRMGGRVLGRSIPATVDPAEAIRGAERAEKAVQAIREARLPVSAQKTARTFQRLVTYGFTASMAQGGTEQLEQAHKVGKDGDSSLAVEYAVEGLVSLGMAASGANHLREEHILRTALNDKTREVYGEPVPVEGEGPQQKPATKFGDLDPYRQAVVINKLIEDDPKYKAADGASEKEQKRLAQKINYRENTAMQQAWNPDAVKRMVRVIDEHQQAQAVEDAGRDHYLKQVAKLIDLHGQIKAEEEELAAAEEERRAAAREGREGRPGAIKEEYRGKKPRPEYRTGDVLGKKGEGAKEREEQRKVTLTTAGQVAEARQGVTAAREAADRGTAAEAEQAAQKAKEAQEPVRQPEEVTNPETGLVTYRGYAQSGEEGKPDQHLFAVAQDPQGNWGVGRNVDGIETFLVEEPSRNGRAMFHEDPETPYIAQDEQTARTLAQIVALRTNADYDIDEHGATPEREKEQKELQNLEQQLIEKKITAGQAREAARLPKEKIEEAAKPRVNQEIEAARAGALNGPLHGRTRAQYEDEFLAGLEEAGWSPREIEAAIDTMGVNLRMEAENNLHYVGRSGDWIASKKGITWVLDGKGMLQPDDGLSAPIPLMKNGRYSAQAIDLAQSGRVGFGQRTWEEAKTDSAREREAQQQFENLTDKVADELQRAIELGKQNAGLEVFRTDLTPPPLEGKRGVFAPPPPLPERPEPEMVSPEREGDIVRRAQESQTAEFVDLIADAVAANSPEPWSVIQRIAKNSGISPQEALRLRLEGMEPPDTLEGRIGRLKAGNTISDKIGLPWMVGSDGRGNLYLRKGEGGARIPFNPLDLDKGPNANTVRRIVGNGEVQPAPGPRYTPEDVRKAAFEAPYVAKRQAVVEEVKARAVGEIKDPSPRTPEQAEAQATAAQERAADVKGAAIVETVKATDPPPGTALPEAEAAVDKAEDVTKTAEEAEWQRIQAKSKTYSEKPFPPRAPITMGPRYTGNAGTIKHLGQGYAFHYAVVPLDSLVNSHVWDGNVLIPNPDYDEALQPRTISEARSGEIVLDAQLRESGSRGYDFDYYGSKGIDPLNGPAIVEAGGRVAGGNTRIAMMRKHLEILDQADDPEIERARFRLQMAQLAQESGITGLPDNAHDYVVVRMLDEPITTLQDASLKGMVFNTSPSHDIGEAAKGVALAKQLSDSTLEDIGRMLDEHDTLGAAIAANPQVFTEIVTNELGVPSTEDAQWFNNTKSGKVLSEAGRRKFAQVLMGRILDDTSVMESLQGTPAYTAVERAVINIVRMKATKNAPLVDKIVEAIHAAKKTWDTGIAGEGVVDRWTATYDPKATTFDFATFEVPPMPDKVVEAIWRAIHAGPRTLSDRVKAYNETDRPSQGGMFSFESEKQKLETPVELFNRVFGKEMKEVNYQREGKRGEGITEAEYNAAMENRGNLSDEAVEDAKRVEDGKPAVTLKGQIIPPGESQNIHPLAADEAIRRFRAGEDVFGAITAGKPEDGIIPLETESEIREFGDSLFGNRKPERTLEKPGALTPPPEAAKPEIEIAAAKAEKGYVTSDELEKFLTAQAPTADHAPEIMRTARMMAEYVFDSDPPEGVDKKDALDWILKERVSELAYDEKGKGRGSYSDPNIEKGIGTHILKLTKASDETTFIHEFAHVVFPFLSEEDMRAIDTIKGEGGEHWTQGQPLRGESYRTVSEKFAHGLEKFLRDENPVGFSEAVKKVLAKIKKIFQQAYTRWQGDPLSPFSLSEEARGVFADMFHIEDFDVADEWKKERDAARKAETKQKKGMVKPEEKLHPVQQLAKDLGPKPVQILESVDGEVEDSSGDRVDPSKPMVALVYGDESDAAQVYIKAIDEGSGISGVEFVHGKDGKYAVRFNVKAKVPKDILYQEAPERKVEHTPEFTRWFSGSHVVDEHGEPLLVHRGVDTEFDPSKVGSGHFAPNYGRAGNYALSGKGTVVSGYLNIQNPMPWKEAFKKTPEEIADAGYDGAINRWPDGHILWGIITRPDQFHKVEESHPHANSVLYQGVPEKHPGLQLEDLEAKLKTTTSPVLQKFLRTQIERMKAEIRHETPPEAVPGLAKQAIAEVKRGTEGRTTDAGRARVSNLRGVPDGTTRDGEQKGVGRISRPPVMGMPGHAGAGSPTDRTGPGRGNAQPVNLASVEPVKINPLPQRGAPVGILAGQAFDEKEWRDGLKRAGLPQTVPPPTVTLSPEVARVLKYGGQKQTAQTILSALEQGDGAVIASSTGSGKSYTAGAVVKETLLRNPDAKLLVITKNRGLLKTAAKIGKDNFSYEMELETPEGALDKNVYGASYQRLLNNAIYAHTQWDLVVADESGEARNWFQDVNQQGKLLKAVMDNAKKGVYVSATPFHSPMEYGYLDKLNLWPKGQFEDWIKQNFAHEKIGDKVIAKLDPAKQAKLRQQLIERGQMVSQEISYDGFTTHFGVVPVTDIVERKLDRIHQGIAVMKRELLKQGKKGLAERVAAFEATYTKAYLERSRLPEAIQLARRARAEGWQVIIFSETTSEDLFRRPVGPREEPGTYRALDEETGGQISRVMPEFPNIMDQLKSEFGDEIGDYSGLGNTDAQREESKEAFLKGQKPLLYTSYAAGGIGVSLHDEDGDKPRVSLFLGPPYSGVLLEQALGRTWRFGVKSNARAVFLATDSEPDIRLMATKVGPRMRALRASVLGERDSLASVMANYTDEEKMREHQDMLAYSEQGNEVKVDAQGFQVRSKRKVNFDNWSAISFPSAEDAKNKGMQVEMSGGGKGSDWATLYQEKPRRWEPPNRPLTIEDIRIRRAVNAAADAAAKEQVPSSDIAMAAVKAEDVAKAAPEGIDKEAAATGAMKTLFNGEAALQDEEGGWTVAHDAIKRMAQGVRMSDDRPWKKRLWSYQFSQDSNIVHTLRKLGREGVGWNIVNMREDFYQKEDGYDADNLYDLLGIFQRNKLDPHDEDTVRKIIDVVEGHAAVADPAINKAAGELSDFMKDMRDFLAKKDVKLIAKDGTRVPYKNIASDPKHIPHFINYDAKLTDPETGETKTLREVMGHTFGELSRLRYMEAYARKIGRPVEEAKVWIEDIKRRMAGARLGQVRAERTVNVPFYYKDFDHLVKYVKQVSTAAAMEETFGGEMENLKKEVAKIPNDQARRDVLASFTSMFEVPDWNTPFGKIVRKGQGFEALTKMPLSVLKVPFHLVHATIKVGIKNVMKAGVEWIKNPNEFRREKYQLGVVGTRTDNPWLLEGSGRHGLGGEVFRGTGFDIAYRWVRGIAGESANVYMEQDALGALKEGGKRAGAVRRILNRTMLIGDHEIEEAVRNGKWSEESLVKAQRAFANKVTFARNPGQMPELARVSMSKDLTSTDKDFHAALRGTYALMSFSVKTYSFLRDSLYDEVVIHHNWKPLLPFVLLYPAAGQMITGVTTGVKHGINLASEDIQGKEHKRDSFDNWWQQFSDVKDHPYVGLFKIWLDGACVAAAMERTKRVADLVMLMAEGHDKQVDSMFKYWLNDELEQDFGSIYTDMLYFAGFGLKEGHDIWKYAHDQYNTLTATERNVFEELEKGIPLTKNLPWVDELAHKKLKSRSGGGKKWSVPQ